MGTAIQPVKIANPNPKSTTFYWKKNTSSTSTTTTSMAFCSSSPAPLRFHSLRRIHSYTVSSILVATNSNSKVSPIGLGLGFHPPNFDKRPVLAFAASHEESKPSEIEVEDEKNDIELGAKESEEAWKQTLASFKDQALKVQSVSQEAYELYSKKAMVILKETSEQLKIQAEKAKQDLIVIANEISEESKEYLSTAAERSPEPMKDIVETFASSTDNLNEISKVRDFYVGIPYGVLLSFGGFLSFMLTGSISAIRFGVVLGGTLLALSVSSLRSWKKGESSSLALKGQAAIASILFLRDVRILFVRSSYASFLAALISGAVVAFYVYRIRLNEEETKRSNFEPGKEI
ncbi:hypothetical protein LguiB_035497 [Lonicera macranthoides]